MNKEQLEKMDSIYKESKENGLIRNMSEAVGFKLGYELALQQGQTLPIDSVSICVCGTEEYQENTKRADNLTYCSKCNKPY